MTRTNLGSETAPASVLAVRANLAFAAGDLAVAYLRLLREAEATKPADVSGGIELATRIVAAPAQEFTSAWNTAAGMNDRLEVAVVAALDITNRPDWTEDQRHKIGTVLLGALRKFLAATDATTEEHAGALRLIVQWMLEGPCFLGLEETLTALLVATPDAAERARANVRDCLQASADRGATQRQVQFLLDLWSQSTNFSPITVLADHHGDAR